MKKHDRIFVPRDAEKDGVSFDDNWHVSHEGFAGPDMKPIEVMPRTDVIVMTPAELEDIWNAGMDAADRRVGVTINAKQVQIPLNTPLDFKTYIQSKGITL